MAETAIAKVTEVKEALELYARIAATKDERALSLPARNAVAKERLKAMARVLGEAIELMRAPVS
jgi:hypothetical protein